MLKDKVALVTGSSSGIGLGITQGLAASGISVALHGIEVPEQMAEQVKALQDLGVACRYFQADISVVAEIEQLVAAVKAALGRIDILVNNAGIQHVAPVETFPVEAWDRVLAVNLSACFHTTRLVLSQMRKLGYGRIINIASAHGLVASAHKSAYVAAKHGLVGLTKVVALETAQEDITCNAICPGWVCTPLVEAQIRKRAGSEDAAAYQQAKAQLLSEKQPSGAFVTSEQIAGLALFLCSEAGSQVRGAAWNIDGGWCAQ